MIDHITTRRLVLQRFVLFTILEELESTCAETFTCFISSCLDYCNSLLFVACECHLHELQRVQNAQSCVPNIPGEHILSHRTSAEVITLAACMISYCF